MPNQARNLLTFSREWLALRLWPTLLIVLLLGALVGRASAAAAPSVSLTSTVAAGNVPTLAWSAPWATSCSASGGWTGTRAPSGSQVVTAITASTTYSLTCSGIADTTATLTCAAPTQNTDGSALTDLAGFRFYEGPSAGSLLNIKQVAGSACTVQYIGLSLGTHYFAVAAYTTPGAESAPSNVVSKAITAAESASASVKVNIPKAPGLTVVDPTAYNVKLRGLRLVLDSKVGTVPVGTACNKDVSLSGGYYRVDRKAVAFARRNSSAVIVAKCA